VPRPPQNSTTFMSKLLGIGDRYFGNGNNEFRAPFLHGTHLLDDLVLKIPRQDEDVVGLGDRDSVKRQDRDVHSRSETPVLVGIAVDGKVEEVGADSAVVEQCVALARCSVSANRLAGVFGLDQKREQLSLSSLHLIAKGLIGFNLEKSV